MANLSFNPSLTSTVAGSFSTQTDGYIQGTMLDDPAVRHFIANGVVQSTEALPIWGGIAISEYIPASTLDGALGPTIGRATTNANITGFTIFNQANAFINTPQSEVPTATTGMTAPFVRLGSGARLAVAIDPSLVSLDTGLITQQVSWDLNAQRIVPYSAATATVSITSMTGAWTNTGNPATSYNTIAIVAAAATDVGAVGDTVTISGATNTGTGGNAVVNGTFIVTAFTNNQNFSITVPAPTTGWIGTIAGTILANQGIGALNVKILHINIGSSKIVTYDAINNFAHWLNTGSTAIISI